MKDVAKALCCNTGGTSMANSKIGLASFIAAIVMAPAAVHAQGVTR